MMSKRLLALFNIILFSVIVLNGQTKQVSFDSNKPDNVLLESIIKFKLDSIRLLYGLKKLHNDSALYYSAKNHSEYCKSSQRITYEQESRKYKYPQNRAEACGAKNYRLGEILLKLEIDPTFSYQKIADTIANSIICDTISKAHIVSRMYRIIGVSTSFDKNLLYLVIDLASVNQDYQIRFNKEIFPYDNSNEMDYKLPKSFEVKSYDWKIKAPKNDEDFDAYRKILDRLKTAGVKQDGTRLSIVFDKESSLKQLVESKKDGFAIEVINFNDYNCLNPAYYKPSRRNDQSLLNGILMKPRYYEDIFKENGSVDEKADNFIRDIGSIKTDADIFEANAIALKKNRIFAVLKPSHICGNEFIYVPAKIPYLDNLYDPNYEPPVTYDTLKLKVYFKTGQTEAKPEDVKEIIEFVKKEGLVITKAYVNANASIEGSPQVNKMLFEERAANIISLLESEQDYHIRSEVKTQENWGMFFSQLRNSKFSNLINQDTAYIRFYVNDSIEYFSEMLDEQRYAQVNLFAVTKATRDKYKVYAINEYKDLLPQITEAKEKNKEKILERLLEKAESIQLFLFDQYNRRKIDLTFVNLMKIPEDDIFIRMKFNRLMFDFQHIAKPMRIDEYSFFSEIKKLALIPNASNLVYSNFLAYLINHYGEETGLDYQNSKSVQSLIQKAGSDGIEDKYIQQFNLHFNYLRSFEYLESLDFKRARNSLSSIYDFYKSQDEVSSEILVNLAEYFILFNELDKAEDIVKPLAFKEIPDHKALILYLKLCFMDYWKEERTEEYYRPLFEATKVLTNEEWSNLFIGECNISFQIFDYEPLWKLYCLKNN